MKACIGSGRSIVSINFVTYGNYIEEYDLPDVPYPSVDYLPHPKDEGVVITYDDGYVRWHELKGVTSAILVSQWAM